MKQTTALNEVKKKDPGNDLGWVEEVLEKSGWGGDEEDGYGWGEVNKEELKITGGKVNKMSRNVFCNAVLLRSIPHPEPETINFYQSKVASSPERTSVKSCNLVACRTGPFGVEAQGLFFKLLLLFIFCRVEPSTTDESDETACPFRLPFLWNLSHHFSL